MNAKQILIQRAVFAHWLAEDAKASLTDIRAILRCGGPEEVRRLKARGRNIARRLDGPVQTSAPNRGEHAIYDQT